MISPFILRIPRIGVSPTGTNKTRLRSGVAGAALQHRWSSPGRHGHTSTFVFRKYEILRWEGDWVPFLCGMADAPKAVENPRWRHQVLTVDLHYPLMAALVSRVLQLKLLAFLHSNHRARIWHHPIDPMYQVVINIATEHAQHHSWLVLVWWIMDVHDVSPEWLWSHDFMLNMTIVIKMPISP